MNSSHCPISTADLLRQELGNTVSKLNKGLAPVLCMPEAKNGFYIFKLLKKKKRLFDDT